MKLGEGLRENRTTFYAGEGLDWNAQVISDQGSRDVFRCTSKMYLPKRVATGPSDLLELGSTSTLSYANSLLIENEQGIVKARELGMRVRSWWGAAEMPCRHRERI